MSRYPEVKDVVRGLVQAAISPHLADVTIFAIGSRFRDLFKQPLPLQIVRGYRGLFRRHEHPATAFVQAHHRIPLNQSGQVVDGRFDGEIANVKIDRVL